MDYLKKIFNKIFCRTEKLKNEKVRMERESILKEKVVTLYDNNSSIEDADIKDTFDEDINENSKEEENINIQNEEEFSDDKNQQSNIIEKCVIYEERSSSPIEVDLSKEGKLDWIQFNSFDIENIDRKNIDADFIKELKLFGDRKTALAIDTKTNYIYQDAKNTKESLDNNKTGIIIYGEDSGIQFNIPYIDNEEHYLNIYLGSWKSKVVIEGYINDELIPAIWDTFECKDCTLSEEIEAKHKLIKIKYKLMESEDKIRINIYIDDIFDESYGNMTIQAITLS